MVEQEKIDKLAVHLNKMFKDDECLIPVERVSKEWARLLLELGGLETMTTPIITITREIEVEVEVYCGICRAHLCNQSEGGENEVTVEPCEACLENATDEGYAKGFEDGKEVGFEEGARE